MMPSFFGLPVYYNQLMPKSRPVLEISPHFKVSAAFRAKYNAWLRQRFGEKPLFCVVNVPDLLGNSKKAIICHPDVEPRLRELQAPISAKEPTSPYFLFNRD